jgi:hypothetical protein
VSATYTITLEDLATGVFSQLVGNVIQFTTHTDRADQEIKELNQDLERTDREARDAFDTKPVDEFNNHVNRTGNEVNSLSGVIKNAGNALGGLFALQQVWQIGSESIEEYDQKAKVTAETMATLASTNHAAGRSIEQLKQQADGLESVTLFDGDDTMGAQKLLLTFKNVKGEVFDKAIPMIQDMATQFASANGGVVDLKGSAIQLGKALDDPIKGVAALHRVGVSFSEAQMEQIKHMQTTGDLAGAQTLILKELETQVGGVAEAARNAGAGGMQAMGLQIKNIKEDVGQGLVGAFNVFSPILQGVVTLIGDFVGFLVNGGPWVKAIAAAVLGAAIAIGVIVVATKAWTVAQWLLNIAMDANPIGIVIVAIAAFATAIYVLWEKVEGFRAFLYGLWDAVKEVFMGIGTLAKSYLGGVGDMIIGIVTFDGDRIKQGFSELGNAFSNYGKNVAKKFSEGYKKGVASFKEDNQEVTPGTDPQAPTVPTGGDGTNLNAGVSSVTGDKGAAKNIYISIENLVRQLNIYATTVKEGASQMKDHVVSALVDAGNDANLIAGQ